MEDIITQKFTYATITVFKDYCKIIDKKESLSSMGVDLDSLDDGDDDVFESAKRLIKFTIDDMRRPTVGRTTEFPEKVGKRKTKFFYGVPGINERTIINYAIRNFETRDDRHIKKYYGSPFSEITVNTIERSIRRHGDKITIKVYRHHSHRAFNNIYFRKSTSVESVTFNMCNGNFTTLSINKSGRKTTKTFRTNNFNFLEMQFKDGGILSMRKSLGDDSVLLKEYNETFNNTDFIFEIDKVFNLNQNFSFNGTWFCQLMLERFVELKKIKVSNNYEYWIKKYYPTEKFLKKNDRKLIASILDLFEIKSKITIKLMHENSKMDINSLARLCYFFGDNFSKYIGSIETRHFLNTSNESSYSDGGHPKFKFAKEFKNHEFQISNNEKENIVKILNNLNCEVKGYQRIILTHEKETLINPRFVGDLHDHFNMIKKLREFIPDLQLRAKNIDDFDKEHVELSKMMKFIKKGYVIEYRFADKMVEDVESPIKVKINLSDDESKPEWVTPEYYPHILKREEEYDEEGRFMHHCVASYSDKDRSIIISVRTDDGKDRVTCEFDCQTGNMIQARHFCNAQPPADIALAIEQLKRKATTYARMGILHCIESKKVPVKINGIEVIPEKKEPIAQSTFDRLFEPHF
jgi:hypothetical protein